MDHWPEDPEGPGPELWCQNGYLITFGDGTEIVITLGGRNVDSGKFEPAANNIAVFPSREEAARHGLEFPG